MRLVIVLLAPARCVERARVSRAQPCSHIVLFLFGLTGDDSAAMNTLFTRRISWSDLILRRALFFHSLFKIKIERRVAFLYLNPTRKFWSDLISRAMYPHCTQLCKYTSKSVKEHVRKLALPNHATIKAAARLGSWFLRIFWSGQLQLSRNIAVQPFFRSTVPELPIINIPIPRSHSNHESQL